MATGGRFIGAGVIYFFLVFLWFAFFPVESIVASSATFNTSDITFNTTVTENADIRESMNFIKIFFQLFTFQVEGILWWQVLLLTYIPLVFIALGIVLVIRGGS